MKRVVAWVAVVVVVAVAAFGVWRYKRAHAASPVTYQTTDVSKRHIVGRVTATGTLLATVTVQVGTQVSGRLQKILVDYNSPVKKGDLVAKIDPLLFQAAVEQARANYQQAKASLAAARATADQNQKVYARELALQKENLASQQDVDTAQTAATVAAAQVDVAAAGLAQAAASLHQSETNLSYTNITSPIDGTVISRSVDVGQTVAASLQAPTLFTIAEDLRKMQVNTNVSEGDVGRLQQGMSAYFTVDAFPGQRFGGKIAQIRNSATTVQNVVTYDAVIDVNNDDLRLRPGMTANVTIVYDDERDVLSVPNAALRFRPPPESGVKVPDAASASGGGGRRGRDRDGGGGGGDPSGGGPGPGPGPGPGSQGRGGGGGGAPNDAKTVWILVGGVPTPSNVKVGLSDGAYTAIVGGDLKEGDVVIVDASVEGKAPSAPTTTTRRPF
jgi:HlyD family secretion protein